MNNKKLSKSITKNFNALPDRCKELFFEQVLNCSENLDAKTIGSAFISLFYCVDMAYEECQSPIEVILNFTYDLVGVFDLIDNFCIELYPQSEIQTKDKKYVADFEIIFSSFLEAHGYCCENEVDLIVECDGHEFHEKTKEQVEYGNQRDMALKMEGYEIVHFSGSQIYKDPIKCLKQINDLFLKKAGRIWQM